MIPASIRLPTAVVQAALLTEIVLLGCLMAETLDLEQLRSRFVQRVKVMGIPRPVYSRFSNSLDEFVDEHIADGFIEAKGASLFLTPRGRSRLEQFRAELAHLTD